MQTARFHNTYSKMIRCFLVSFILFLSLSSVSAQKIHATDSLQILAIVDDWNKAWQTKDFVMAARGYSNDARFTNAFGDKRDGQNEVQALLQQVFALPFVMAGSSETSEHRFQILEPATVVLHTSVVRKGQRMPDGSVLPDRQTTHLRVLRKTDNRWEIKAHLISDARDKQSSKH